MKRRVSDIAVMILSFLVLLALSAETALVGVEAVRGEQWQLIRLTAWLQGSGVWGGIACVFPSCPLPAPSLHRRSARCSLFQS